MERIVERSVYALRKTIKHADVVPPVYMLIDKDRNVTVVPNLGEIPTSHHVSIIKPLVQNLDIEYVILTAEGSMLVDGVKRSEQDWKDLYKKYGSLNNHPEKKDSVNVILYSAEKTIQGCALVKSLSSKKNTRTFGELQYSEQPLKDDQGVLTGFFN
ncbi:hypothetical protein ABIB38_004824 [Massilia sp. UYP11]|uniref:hypothetical protein n=1 Tax=Massilia sp. UYP11 TaxID=1756385 RepID=UPI003D1D37AF